MIDSLNSVAALPVEDDAAWAPVGRLWQLRADTLYLNHGSFGPAPLPVLEARRRWQQRLDEQPMDFFFRLQEPAWRDARQALARFVATDELNLAFVDNATFAMNVVATSFPLSAGHEVLLTNHEYGAVRRIWERACREAGAAPPVIADLPLPITSEADVVDAIFARVTPRTRLLVVSHITSPTAVILPVAAICQRAKQAGIAVCVDGPHALLQTDVRLDELGCDFYAASCHKWLCAPFGSGFLFVAPRFHSCVQPPNLSWGRLLPKRPEHWSDEFIWSGTRDPSPFLAVPDAIQFFERLDILAVRRRLHFLAREARRRIVELTGLEPLIPDEPRWYGSMAHVPLPPGDAPLLQDALWRRFQIEVPIVAWHDRRWIRVSCHLYNTQSDLDRLCDALRQLAAG